MQSERSYTECVYPATAGSQRYLQPQATWLGLVGFVCGCRYTVLFAVARTVGWVAQWKEMAEEPLQKISRPRQVTCLSLLLVMNSCLRAAVYTSRLCSLNVLALDLPFSSSNAAQPRKAEQLELSTAEVKEASSRSPLLVWFTCCLSVQIYSGNMERPFVPVEKRGGGEPRDDSNLPSHLRSAFPHTDGVPTTNGAPLTPAAARSKQACLTLV